MRKALSIFAISCCWNICFSQQHNSYDELLEARRSVVIDNHEEAYVSHILTGKKYNLHYSLVKNNQFFKGRFPEDGTLKYDGVVFHDLEMQYDLAAQQIVILLESKNHEQYVSIDIEKIQSFSILNSKFLNIKKDSVMKKGLYQLAFEGKHSQLFVRHTKERIEKIEDMQKKVEYKLISKYFVRSVFGTFRISGKKDLLNSLDNSSELLAALKKNKIRFPKNKKEVNLIRALSLYDSIIL